MERIDKGYAIIYIDSTGEFKEFTKSVNDEVSEEVLTNFFEKKIISDYYSNGGHIQWNFYYFVVSEDEDFFNPIDFRQFDLYCRVKVFNTIQSLESYVEDYYPDYKEIDCEVISDFRYNSHDYKGPEYHNKKNKFSMIKSIEVKENMMDVLTQFDFLRAKIIKGELKKLHFITHIEGEHSLFNKKFSFLKDKFKIESWEKE